MGPLNPVEPCSVEPLRLPKVHKFFAIFCIGLPRLVIAGVILVVGAFFLTATNNLQDLVLNSTAPWL